MTKWYNIIPREELSIILSWWDIYENEMLSSPEGWKLASRLLAIFYGYEYNE